jgi:hypothetical protein
MTTSGQRAMRQRWSRIAEHNSLLQMRYTNPHPKRSTSSSLDPSDARNEEHRSAGILCVCRVSEHRSDDVDDESELELGGGFGVGIGISLALSPFMPAALQVSPSQHLQPKRMDLLLPPPCGPTKNYGGWDGLYTSHYTLHAPT